MTSASEILREVRRDKSLSGPAQYLIEKLSLISGEDLWSYERRWFWELLQNARDAGDMDDPDVNVRLVIEPDRVVFSHNGPPLKARDADNLITPDSNKTDYPGKRKKIGRFGSGFISTHVLSGVITVNCIVEEGSRQAIEYVLDRRSYLNKRALETSIDLANGQLKEQLEDSGRPERHNDDGFNTSFGYDLRLPLDGVDSRRALRSGLEHIMEVMPFTLVFLPNVGSVEIVNSAALTFLPDRVVFSHKEGAEGEILVHCDETVGEEKRPRRTTRMRSESQGTTTVCVCLEKNSAGRDSVIPFADEVPRLFCYLPLVARENFCSPILIHSECFSPKDDRRQDISLTENDSSKGNWSALSEATVAYARLLKALGDAGTHNLFHLAIWPNAIPRSEEIDEKIKSRVLSSWTESLLTTPVVLTKQGMKPLGDVRIPFIPRDKEDSDRLLEVYELLESMPAVTLPVWDDTGAWFKASAMPWGKERLCMIKEVVDAVAGWGSLEVLCHHIPAGVDWLVRLLQHVATYCPNYLVSHAIIPDAVGGFHKRTDDLHWGVRDLPSPLIQIYDGLQDSPKDFYGVRLIHSDVCENERIKELTARKSLEVLCEEIDGVFKSRKLDEKEPSEKELSAIRRVEEWAKIHGTQELKRLFEWYSRRRSHIIFWTMTPDEKVRVLSMKEEDKIAVLADLGTNLSKEALLRLAKDPAAVLIAIGDPSDSQAMTGWRGEEAVFERLKSLYRAEDNYEVIESHKNGVREFDFEVKHGTATVLYVDAKSTSARMSDSDKVLIWVRPSQWNFLRSPEAYGKYVLARPFLGDGLNEVQWLAVQLLDKPPPTVS